MKGFRRSIAALGVAVAVTQAIPASAQQPPARAALTLPATGTASRGMEFTGTISINRFEASGDEIFAVGLVSGVLSSRGHNQSVTVVAGEKRWPVIVRSGGQRTVSGAIFDRARPSQIRWSPGASQAVRVLPVQAASCPVLNLALGPLNVDLLGVQVALSAVSFNLSGASDQPLGALVCEVSEFVGTVADLVGLLNNVLGLVTGLLGGLLGGLGGGVVPAP